MSVNKQILLGNLGQDPELRMTQSGQQVCNLAIATNEVWYGKDNQKQEKTEWHRVIIWGKMAENAAKYLKKGSTVYIEGRTETRVWEKDGVKQYAKEVVATEMKFVGGNRSDSGSQQRNTQQPQGGYEQSYQSDEDVPF